MGDLEEPLVGKTDEEIEKEEAAPQKSAFWTKFSLAISMAFWVTLFYVPLVVPTAHEWFFVKLDLPNVLGSPDFESYWPNTVQLIVFTVYFSTGSTVNLAWQGLCGTVVAGLNQVMMGKLFPLGGKCLKMSEYTGSGIRGFCEEYADPHYAKYEWFVWFDVFFFMFLALSSNAKENTMKFSLSWHIAYMMAFMSPAGYQPSHAVNITSVFGVSLAVLITLVPSITSSGITFKQMVAINLKGHPEGIAQKVKEISNATIRFMLADKPTTIDQRYHYKVDKVAIQMKVDDLSGMAGAMSSDYSVSWWEGWIYAMKGGTRAVTQFRRVRTHCGIFATAFADDIGGFDDVAFVMKKVVSATDASNYKFMTEQDLQEIGMERQQMAGLIQSLNTASMNLLVEISTFSKAPQAENEVAAYSAKISDMKQDIDQKFSALYNEYTQWTQQYSVQHKSKARQILRSNMSVFIFSICQLSKEVMDLSDKVLEKYSQNVTLAEKDLATQTAQGVMSEFVSTWLSGSTPSIVKAFVDAEKRSFVFRNLISIGLCFVMGNVLQGNVFAAPFNPLLAGTLAVLISHFPGSAFYKNLMRLLGLAIGNALPIIMLAVVTLAGSWMPYAHLCAFFLFELYFSLMYYTSPEWSYVGCIVAGFGCYSFTTETWSEATFDAAYCKIGQVTAAIVVQILVDMIDTSIMKKFPQNIVVKNMKMLTKGLVEVFEMFQEHLSSIDPKPELMAKIQEKAGELKGIMDGQRTLVGECETKTIMIAGPKPAFQLDLYKGSLKAIEEILGEVDALCLMDEFSEKLGRKQGEWFDQQYKAFYTEIYHAMKQTFTTLETILEKKDEGLVPKSKVKVCLIDEDPTDHTEAVRMAVVKRIMADTLQHILDIEHLCCESGSLEFQI